MRNVNTFLFESQVLLVASLQYKSCIYNSSITYTYLYDCYNPKSTLHIEIQNGRLLIYLKFSFSMNGNFLNGNLFIFSSLRQTKNWNFKSRISTALKMATYPKLSNLIILQLMSQARLIRENIMKRHRTNQMLKVRFALNHQKPTRAKYYALKEAA